MLLSALLWALFVALVLIAQGLSNWLPQVVDNLRRVAGGLKACVVVDSSLTAHDFEHW